MAYKFIVLPDAEKQIREFEPSIAKRIIKKLAWISQQEFPLRFATPLHNASIGDIRFRIGDYRAIALVDEKKKRIVIAVVGHRKEVYR
jgi:mRNA-degrading endonuclease RelE of RelBE toxin-antitoxin system